MVEQQQSTANQTPIRCSETSKLLARHDADALYLWCKECKCWHRIPFAEFLEKLAR